jgi:hypothetical protein
MKTIWLLLLPAIVLGQINAKYLVAEKFINEDLSAGCMIQVDVTEKGKTSNYTALDESFLDLCKSRPVDLAKSVSAAFDKAKSAKTKIKLVDKGGKKLTVDPEKDNRKSAISTMEAALKAGYVKKADVVSNDEKIKS